MDKRDQLIYQLLIACKATEKLTLHYHHTGDAFQVEKGEPPVYVYEALKQARMEAERQGYTIAWS